MNQLQLCDMFSVLGMTIAEFQNVIENSDYRDGKIRLMYRQHHSYDKCHCFIEESDYEDAKVID